MLFGRFGDFFDALDRVDRDLDIDAIFGEPGDARQLVAADHLVGDQDVVAEACRDLSLADGRAGEPGARAAGELAPGDLGGLVGFEVWPQLAIAGREEAGHALNVAFHAGDIDDERGRRDVGDGAGRHASEFAPCGVGTQEIGYLPARSSSERPKSLRMPLTMPRLISRAPWFGMLA